MNIQDLTNLYNKRIRYDHHAENYRCSMIEDKTPYGLQINRKLGIQTVLVDFIEKWNEILNGTEWKLVELLLTESVTVSKTIEGKFEEKLKETFQTFKRLKRHLKKQLLHWKIDEEKNGVTLKIKIDLQSKERDRKRKLREKSLKLSFTVRVS